jgi:hypothetical protein
MDKKKPRKKYKSKKSKETHELIQRKTLKPFSIDSFIIKKTPKNKFNDLSTDSLFEQKYTPICSSKVIGNVHSKEIFQDWINKKVNNEPSKNLCIVYGSSGVGKSISVNLILKENGFEVIELNSDIYPQKKEFLETLRKILSSKTIGNIFGMGKSSIVIENLEGTLGEGIFYNNFIDIINNNKPISIPIVCISSSDKLKKKYNTPTKLEIIEFKKPEIEELITFTAKILKKEKKKITIDASKLTIKESKGDIRKLLHYIKLFSMSKKEILNKNNILNILHFSESDIFFNAYEVLEDTLKIKSDRKVEIKINLCMVDQPLIIDLIYSNIPNMLNLKNISGCLDSMSYSDNIQTSIYKDHNWELRDYLITSSCIKPMNIIKNNTQLPKSYVFRKNQLNNLPWTCLRNRNTYNDINNCSIYNLNSLDIQYAYKNIFVEKVEKEKNQEKLNLSIKEIVNCGISFNNYFKLRNIVFCKPETVKKKIKDKYEKIWKEYDNIDIVEKSKKK